MKKLFLSLSVLLISLAAMAQDNEGLKPTGNRRFVKRESAAWSKVYLDLSTGLNNNGGLLGVGMDVHVTNDVSINAGLGLLSTWGFKLYGGGKYFFKANHKGWALGGGVTYNTGIEEFKSRMETIAGKQDIVVKLEPQLNAYVSAYKYWNVGRGSNRMFLQLGFSAPLSQHKFTQVAGAPLTSTSSDALRTLAPGGLILGFGFSFGLHSNNR